MADDIDPARRAGDGAGTGPGEVTPPAGTPATPGGPGASGGRRVIGSTGGTGGAGGAGGAGGGDVIGGPAGTGGTGGAGGGASGGDVSGGGGGGGTSRTRTLVIGVVVAAVVLAAAAIALAVSSGSGPTKKSASSTTTVAAQHSGPLCPLTGTPAPGGQVPDRPALAVKVDNYPAARPQSGLEKADMVFEEPVEGGITRLVAVFQCQGAAEIGPIRSARAVDLPILDQLSRPILIHVGGISPVLSILKAGNLIDENLFYLGSITQHLPGRYAPYDTYVSSSAAWGLVKNDTTPPAALFQYSSSVPSGTAVSAIHIPFSGTNDTHWAWDAHAQQWLLSYGTTPATVEGGGRIAATNIVVQTVRVTYGPWLENEEGGLEVQSQMTGSGPLLVLRNGVAVSGTWNRASISDPTSLVATGGTPIALAPGVTWVEIVPSTLTVTTTPAAVAKPTASSP